MELWIRSQDKNILCEAIHFELSSSGLSILGQNKAYYGVVLGRYKSKERALEVLDEIQKLLKPIHIFHKGEKYQQHNEIVDITPNVVVYEMPKE